MKRCVIIQPMFFPWRGQFDLQSRADVVILLDNVQWVRRHWYNRNLIHGPAGEQWITVPVNAGLRNEMLIRDVLISRDDRGWRRRMLETIRHAYGKAASFNALFPDVRALIEEPCNQMATLAEGSLRISFRALGRDVSFLRASELPVDEPDPILRLVRLCQHVGATHYLSGPAAKAYIGDSTVFAEAGIVLEWMVYSYPPYPQQRPFRERELSILDLLFNVGRDAPGYIWPEGHPRDK